MFFESAGMAAGVISIAQVGAQLSLALYKFADTARNASKVCSRGCVLVLS